MYILPVYSDNNPRNGFYNFAVITLYQLLYSSFKQTQNSIICISVFDKARLAEKFE